MKVDWERLIGDIFDLAVHILVSLLYAWIIFVLWNVLSFLPEITYVESVAICFLFEMVMTMIKRKPLF